MWWVIICSLGGGASILPSQGGAPLPPLPLQYRLPPQYRLPLQYDVSLQYRLPPQYNVYLQYRLPPQYNVPPRCNVSWSYRGPPATLRPYPLTPSAPQPLSP